MFRRIILGAFGAILLGTAVASAHPNGDAAFVRSLYIQYAGVEPGRRTVEVWVDAMNRGTDAQEVQAQILGSNQVFDRVGKDCNAWIELMYGEVLGRRPDADGFRHWQRKLDRLKHDRVKVAREFLCDAQVELAARRAEAACREEHRPRTSGRVIVLPGPSYHR